MIRPTFSTQRPTREGLYLAWRKDFDLRPEVAEIRFKDKKLWYVTRMSQFPLLELEKNVLFSERINLNERQ
jgi:hypothetical protein